MAKAPRGPRPPNHYDRAELAGAFGDLGTLIPFVLGYLTVLHLDPRGVLFMFGISAVATGLYYRTPIPVQPMKAIGTTAIGAAGQVTPAAVAAAGLVTGAFWLLAGATGTVRLAAVVAAKPIVHGILLGLGLSFMSQGVALMRTGPWLAAAGLAISFALLARPRIPAMFALMVLGLAAAAWVAPAPDAWLPLLRPVFGLPGLTLEGLRWTDFVQGTLVLAIPQIPLTLGNAVIAARAENDELFPDRPVTERQLAITQGLMNLVSAPLGGVPMCHGAGGMAGHVRFGARTGGSVVMLGAMLLVLALFYGHAVGGLFAVFPKAILGVILFFAGAELALTVRAAGSDKGDIYVVVVVAGLAMWNMGAAFVAGVLLHQSLRRGWIRV